MPEEELAGPKVEEHQLVGGPKFMAKFGATLGDAVSAPVDFGGNKCVIDGEGNVYSVPLTDDEIAQAQQDTQAGATQRAADQAERDRLNTFGIDANVTDVINRFQTATAAQIDTWLSTNVTTLAQARTVLATVIKVLALVSKQIGVGGPPVRPRG